MSGSAPTTEDGSLRDMLVHAVVGEVNAKVAQSSQFYERLEQLAHELDAVFGCVACKGVLRAQVDNSERQTWQVKVFADETEQNQPG